MDDDQMSINVLPDEILLFIFRKLSANKFIATLPCVCKRWSKIVASDSHTIKTIVMCHFNRVATVGFFYLKNNCEQQILYSLPELCDLITLPYREINFFTTNDLIVTQNVSYETAFYLSTKYAEVYSQVKTLMITHNLNVYHAKGFTCVNNLTTIIFYEVKMMHKDLFTIKEMGNVYPNIQNIMYVSCIFKMAPDIKKYLYSGFKQLKRFRLDHYTVNQWDLEDLLKIHPKLEEIVFDKCCSININDRWIEILIDKLKGRTVKSLCMHSSYLTTKYIDQLLTSGLILDKSKVNIGFEILEFPFSVTIESG